jgi:CDP-paratose synthetase
LQSERKIFTILITGINGFLGSHIANNLCHRFEIIGLGYSLNNLTNNLNQPLKVYSSVNTRLEDIFNDHKIDAVIHTATVYQKVDNSFENLIKTNILLPIQLLELAHRYHLKLFLNTDTFFNQPNPKYSYLSFYTLSKKHFIDWLVEIQGPCKLINVKLFHIYGPNDKPSKFVPFIISSLVQNIKELDLTEGKQLRDFIYVDDVVSVYDLLIEKFERGEALIEEYEVGSGSSISIKEFVLLAKEVSGASTHLKFGALEYRNNEIMESKANIEPLVQLGWQIKNPIKSGIGKMTNFYSK